MCKYLDSACFMANVFGACKDQASFDLFTMRRVRDQVAERLGDQNVVIDWTRDSVLAAFHYYGDVFRRADTHVQWVRAERSEEFVREEFDADLPPEFVDKLWSAIREACSVSR